MKKFYARINQLKNASTKRAEFVTFQRGYFEVSSVDLSNSGNSFDQKPKHKLPFIFQILNILKTQGYIRFFTIETKGRSIFVTVYLKYTAQGDSAFRSISLISTSGRPVYVSSRSL